MEELFVILSCMQGIGCKEISKHYYMTHKDVQDIANTTEQKAKTLVNPFVLEYAGPMVLMSTGADVSVKLTRTLSIKSNKNVTELLYRKDF